MVMSRRTAIRAAGGASLMLIGGGGTFAVTRTPHRALKAWSDIQDAPPTDVRLDAFRHAILAPNPHNRQPWQIQLIGSDQAVITCDLDRRLPETDPLDRQILIGFGCFLELARIAAAERGVRMEIKPFPEGVPADRLDRRPIASLRFVADPATPKDSLFAFIPSRHSAKQPFDTTRPIDARSLDKLTAHRQPGLLIATSNDAALVQKVRAQTWDAWNIELKTQRTWMETVKLMRIGKAEIEANPDAVSVGSPFLDTLALFGQLSREQFATPGTSAYQATIDRYRPVMATAMGYAWIVTDDNTRVEQLAAGRAYVRMNLDAARQGLGFHPISQALQEFPEMAKAYGDMHATLGVPLSAQNRQRVQMLVRLGYGPMANKTPRWQLQHKLVKTPQSVMR
jgi:nitroreductase